ncbi:hypothetical protein EV356DRAFT_554952 [Viridothelium virens]|uniref:Uncharacterized protein n=1 Tax=Viridothelium virens TaxID=1048519 RepID=A0A6A6HIX0_VIRVR|nr:hypothetical protein EV356DRAFT_554952 [Viridothelium virens]
MPIGQVMMTMFAICYMQVVDMTRLRRTKFLSMERDTEWKMEDGIWNMYEQGSATSAAGKLKITPCLMRYRIPLAMAARSRPPRATVPTLALRSPVISVCTFLKNTRIIWPKYDLKSWYTQSKSILLEFHRDVTQALHLSSLLFTVLASIRNLAVSSNHRPTLPISDGETNTLRATPLSRDLVYPDLVFPPASDPSELSHSLIHIASQGSMTFFIYISERTGVHYRRDLPQAYGNVRDRYNDSAGPLIRQPRVIAVSISRRTYFENSKLG